MDAPRPTSTLAADVREALAIGWPEGDHAEPNVFTDALAALDALMARVTDLEAQVASLNSKLSEADQHTGEWIHKAEAAEAQVADLARANAVFRAQLTGPELHSTERVADLEAQVAALTQDRDTALQAPLPRVRTHHLRAGRLPEQVGPLVSGRDANQLAPIPPLCRVRHKWRIWCVSMDGHQSYRERRCERCLDAGIVTIERQPRSYYGTKATGKWERRPQYERRSRA